MRARTKGRSPLKLRLGAIAPLSVAALLATTALIHPVFAQGSVQQFGAVTQNHPAVWLQNGAIGDGGTYPNGLLSAVGVTSNNSKSVWINDVSSQIGQPYHQFTMGLSPTTGAILDYEPIAGATALPLTLTNNGFGQITLGTTGTVTIPILQVGTLNFGSFAFTNITLNGTTTNNGVITGGTITNVTMAGTLTVPKTGLRWNLANPQFTSPTTAQTPLWDLEGPSISGTLGCGTLCVRAPEYDIQSENIKDTVVMNNGAFVANHHDFYFFGPSSGGKVHTILDMRQAGPITPDVTTTTSGGVAQKQSSIGVFNAWLSANNTAGGSIDGGGIPRPFGLAYGGNPKVTLAGQNLASGVPGASLWAALVANGEVDLYIEPSQNSITLSGIVTAGDTLSIAISSAVNPGFGTVTISTVMGVGDALQFATQRLCGSIKFNTVLQASGVGAGCYGAADAVLPNQLNISWPLTSLVGTGGSTDVVITPSVSVGATETLTLGTQLAGASARLKAAQTIIQTKQDGSNGFGNDTVWYIGKQSNGAGWSSGGWRALFEIGGGGQAPFDDLLSQDIEPSSYPMRFDADMFLFVPQTNVSGAPDAPPTNISLHSFLSAGNVDFFAAVGGPISTPGFQSYGDGSDVRGSATLQRLTGNASIAGISLTANGWEGTAVTLVDGGGSNGGTADPGFLLHRYYVGARCFDGYGGGYQIDSIGTHGEVVTFHVIGDGTHFAYPSAAAGTVPATNQGVVGCGGTGWVNGITWTAGNAVNIGGNGQTISLVGTVNLSGATVANTSVNVVAAGTNYGTATIVVPGISIVTSGSGGWVGLATPGTAAQAGSIVNLSGGNITLGVTGTVSLNGGAVGLPMVIGYPSKIDWGFNSGTVAYGL